LARGGILGFGRGRGGGKLDEGIGGGDGERGGQVEETGVRKGREERMWSGV